MTRCIYTAPQAALSHSDRELSQVCSFRGCRSYLFLHGGETGRRQALFTMTSRQDDKVNQEGCPGSPTEPYKTGQQQAEPGRLCRVRLPLLVGVLVVLVGGRDGPGPAPVHGTCRVTLGEFKEDIKKGLVAVKAPGGKTCYIVNVAQTDRDNEKEEGDGGKLAVSLDETRKDQPKLSGELAGFCEGLDPRWATAEPADKNSDADVIVETGT
ncbi:Hypp339 [Branchiostoma lanceolatum]|uniref:Hypp339 protein n=1 Tax=Branchiostoma lanceolatum TaxID=7740 RepID=A0A8J9VYS1_BRALA|nr:Hypp339 [Branchiostoma lanceolatum]